MRRYQRAFLIGITCVLAVALSGCQVVNPKEGQELAYRKAGIQFAEKGDYQSAITAFQKALDNSNGRIGTTELDICFYKAYAYSQSGQTMEALEVYDAILNYDKKAVNAYLQRGNLLAALNQPAEASKDYDQAIALQSGNFKLYMAIYENLMAGGYEELAKGYLRKAMDISTSTGEGYRYKGQIYMLLEEYDQARHFFSEAENAGDEEAKLYMAQAMLLSGNDQGAYGIYENYAQIHKDDAESQCKLVEILMKQGDYESALPYIASAKQLTKEDDRKTLLQYEILAQEYLGDYQEAEKLVREYLAEYPQDEAAKRELIFLQSRQ